MCCQLKKNALTDFHKKKYFFKKIVKIFIKKKKFIKIIL